MNLLPQIKPVLTPADHFGSLNFDLHTAIMILLHNTTGNVVRRNAIGTTIYYRHVN